MRVADPGAHSLAHERRHQVSGVAGEQNSAAAHRLRQQRAELVHGVANDRPLVGFDPRRQQLPDPRFVAELRVRLPGQQHELPAPVLAPVARVHVGTRGVAPLARRRQAVERARCRAAAGRASASAPRSRGPPSRCRRPRRTNEFAPSAPITYRAVTGPRTHILAGGRVSATWSSCCSSASAVQGRCSVDRRLRLRGAVERRLQPRLEEEVAGLPAGRGVVRIQLDLHDLIAVGAEPDVLAARSAGRRRSRPRSRATARCASPRGRTRPRAAGRRACG